MNSTTKLNSLIWYTVRFIVAAAMIAGAVGCGASPGTTQRNIDLVNQHKSDQHSR